LVRAAEIESAASPFRGERSTSLSYALMTEGARWRFDWGMVRVLGFEPRVSCTQNKRITTFLHPRKTNHNRHLAIM
jgi:hypothetical protein